MLTTYHSACLQAVHNSQMQHVSVRWSGIIIQLSRGRVSGMNGTLQWVECTTDAVARYSQRTDRDAARAVASGRSLFVAAGRASLTFPARRGCATCSAPSKSCTSVVPQVGARHTGAGVKG